MKVSKYYSLIHWFSPSVKYYNRGGLKEVQGQRWPLRGGDAETGSLWTMAARRSGQKGCWAKVARYETCERKFEPSLPSSLYSQHMWAVHCQHQAPQTSSSCGLGSCACLTAPDTWIQMSADLRASHFPSPSLRPLLLSEANHSAHLTG